MEVYTQKNHGQLHSYCRNTGSDNELGGVIIDDVHVVSTDGKLTIEVFDRDNSGKFVSVQKIESIVSDDSVVTPWMWHKLAPGQKIRIIEITKSEE